MTDNALNLGRGRSLVLGGLVVAVLGATGFVITALIAGAPVGLSAYGRLTVVVLLAVLVFRGRSWARWLLGVLALFGSAAGLVGAGAAWPVMWLGLAYGALGVTYLGGYLVAVVPKDARAFLAAQAATPHVVPQQSDVRGD
ncbi:MAG: hypothetical protein M3Z54_13770 [Gemmatimonadota bacterium]|nr:hypothetical protein [Gemmatimonadota bacterium]